MERLYGAKFVLRPDQSDQSDEENQRVGDREEDRAEHEDSELGEE